MEVAGEEIVETEWGPYTKKAAEAGKKKGIGTLKCKAAAIIYIHVYTNIYNIYTCTFTHTIYI